MIEPKPSTKKSPSRVAMICLFGGIGIGFAASNLLKASLPIQANGAGFSVIELALAGVCGAIGGGLGGVIGWLFDRIRG